MPLGLRVQLGFAISRFPGLEGLSLRPLGLYLGLPGFGVLQAQKQKKRKQTTDSLRPPFGVSGRWACGFVV